MEAGSSGFSAFSPPVFSGENYQVWTVKMTVFMQGNDLWEAVEDDYEVAPLPENPTLNQIKYYKERVTRKAKAKSCLYAAVSPTIFTRIMRLASAKAIWVYLETEYEGDEKVRGMKVLNFMREFERQQMKEAESVKEYSDRLIDVANKIRILGTDFEDGKIVQKILVSLPERFEATIASLEITKDLSEIKLGELLSALQAQEQRRLMRNEEPIEGALQAKLRFNAVGRGKKQGIQNRNPVESFSKERRFGPAESFSKERRVGAAYQNMKGRQTGWDPCQHCGRRNHPHYKCWRKPDMKCRFCNKFGHAEIICYEKKSQQSGGAQAAASQEPEQLFVASCASASITDKEWLVDSGCSNHMTSDVCLFKELDSSITTKVRIGNGEFLEVKGKGNVLINGHNGTKVLSEVMYVPKIDQNLLSVGQLVEKGFKVIFDKNECLIFDSNGQELFKIPMHGKCFSFNPVEVKQLALQGMVDVTELWHKRLGHFHTKGLIYMKRNDMAIDLPVMEEQIKSCKVCLLGKQVRLPFQSSKWRASEKLELVHTDVCGPMSESSLNGSRYFLLFIDDFSRMSWIYFIKAKSEVAEMFMKFKSWVENQCGKKIKTLRSDNGTEYTSTKFKLICEEAGIDHQFTAPYSPQQNGVSERKNRTIMEISRCLMQEKNLPKSFWAEASSTAVFLLNRLPTKALNKETPYQVWHNMKPKMKNLKVFGCVCYSYVPQVKRDKLDQKSEP